MEKVIGYLIKHPEEAFAVVTGKATPLGVDLSEIFKIIKVLSSSNDVVKPVAGFWT